MRFEVLQETSIRGIRFLRGQVFDGYEEDKENACVRLLGLSPDEEEKREDRLQNMKREQLRNLCTSKGIKFKSNDSKAELMRLIRGETVNSGRITEPLKRRRLIAQHADFDIELNDEGERKTLSVVSKND